MSSGYFLGINGWFERSHDASACIVKNGEILAMAEEERFTRDKHAFDKLPIRSTRWCLDKVGISLDNVEAVGVGWDYKKLYDKLDIKENNLDDLSKVFFPKKYFSYTKKPRIKLIEHHLAHAASAYYLSGMDSAAILVVDGQGEDVSTTIARGYGDKIDVLRSFGIKNSLGYFYEAVSDHIGLGVHAAGKTMGLSSYGKVIDDFEEIVLTDKGYQIELPFKKDFSSLDQQSSVLEAWRKLLTDKFGSKKKSKRVFNSTSGEIDRITYIADKQKDIAASAQQALERTMIHLVKLALKETGEERLCLSGGVALNCSVNTPVARMPEVDELFIVPAASDSGVSLGAALLISKKKSDKQIEHVYYGPSFSNNQIKKELERVKVNYEYHQDIEKKTAQLLNQGNIVSWFQGKMEIGPRALGNRSILANPILEKTHEEVNRAKGREQWRPLAPSILKEHADKYLEKAIESPFMLHTFNIKKEYRKKIPAVVHVDNTTRPQIVTETANPRYHKLINEFGKLSGIYLVLNTSFNGRGEPIVCTPRDALKSFISNSTDYLVLGNYLVKK